MNITLPIAFLAGLLSFVSPCVLPLVPAYIGYLTGQATNTVSSSLAAAGSGGESTSTVEVREPSRWIVFIHGIFFVLGFSAVFVLLFGFGAGLLGKAMAGFAWQVTNPFFKKTFALIVGLLVVVLGLHTMGVIRIPFLYYDTRNQTPPKHELGYVGSFLMGITFAFGWSPCVGPILGGISSLAVTTGSIKHSLLLLWAYALGLGIPFLITALALDRVSGGLKKLRKHMRTIEIVSGLLLITVGVLIAFGLLQNLATNFSSFTTITTTIDNWLLSLTGGQ